MRSIRFLPLVFLIGIDGFVLFAPYVVVVLSSAYFVRKMRPEQQLVAIPAAV